MSRWRDWRLWYAAAQVMLIVLALFGAIGLPWWLIMLPTWAFFAFVGYVLYGLWRWGGD